MIWACWNKESYSMRNVQTFCVPPTLVQRHHPSFISSGLDLQDFVDIFHPCSCPELEVLWGPKPMEIIGHSLGSPFLWLLLAGGQSSATIHDPTKGLNQPQPLAAPYSLYSKFVFCSQNQGIIIGTKIHETCWMPHLWPTMSTTSKV